ncbi:receptor kinase-like protein Xa21 [Nicotiana tomentosiformis]|uniref:receptor kinase-like protein Xa21 n=1 Tax=Nicotiana tomentosiformis TaxID=4098 RepID=UPI0008785D81|nr:receptor kinase-like protein Xa21 [Nicotiana tomentosiformis]
MVVELRGLISLDISRNELVGHLPISIQGLKNLQALNHAENRINGSLSTNLCLLQSLSELYLSRNQIIDPISEGFVKLNSLRKLYFDYNKVMLSVPRSIWNLKDLLLLNLSSNLLNGSLHPDIGNSKAAIFINLSRNNFSNEISVTVGGLSNLINFSLVHQYLPNGNIEKWLYYDNHALGIMRRLNIMIYVAYALEYLLHHGYLKPVVHCDASNVLLDGNLVAHLSDFGIAKIFGDRESIAYTKTLATMGYIAPEYYGMEGLVSTKCHVYSVEVYD